MNNARTIATQDKVIKFHLADGNNRKTRETQEGRKRTGTRGSGEITLVSRNTRHNTFGLELFI